MQKKFLSNLFFLLGLNLLVKPFYILGIDAEIQERVGENEYGLYFAILNLSFIFNILNDFGITNYNNRNISQNSDRFAINFGKLLSSRAILALSYSFVTLVVAALLLYNSRQFHLLAFLILNQIIVSYILFLRSNLAALQLFKQDSIISVLDRVLMILFCALLLWSGLFNIDLKIEFFVYLQSFSYLVSFAVAFIFLKGKLPHLKLKFDWPYTLAILKQSIPYAVLILLMNVYYRVDGVMLERLSSPLEAGIYAKGYRFLEALYNFSFLFSVLLLPIFSRMISQKQNIEKLTALSSKIMLTGVITICIGAAFYAFEIMDWRYSNNVETSARAFQIIILNGIALSATYIFGTLLTAAGSMKLLNITAIFTVITNLILNFLFIPKYGAYGAAWASLTTLFLSALIQALIAIKHFKMKWNFPLISKIVLFSILIVATCKAFELVDLHWFMEFVAIGILGILLSFFIGLFQIKEFLGIIKEESR